MKNLIRSSRWSLSLVISFLGLLGRDDERDVIDQICGRIDSRGEFDARIAGRSELVDVRIAARIDAVNNLGKMGEAGAAHAEAVAALLNDNDKNVQRAAADALSKMGKAGTAHAEAARRC